MRARMHVPTHVCSIKTRTGHALTPIHTRVFVPAHTRTYARSRTRAHTHTKTDVPTRAQTQTNTCVLIRCLLVLNAPIKNCTDGHFVLIQLLVWFWRYRRHVSVLLTTIECANNRRSAAVFHTLLEYTIQVVINHYLLFIEFYGYIPL